MKKTHVGQTVRAATLLVCFIVLLTTCKNNIGMGGTVDINPPTIRNDSVYPPNNAIIKGAFTLAVKVDDDTGVNAVTAVITTADAHNSKINIGDSFLTQPSSDDEYWTLDIDPKGQYPIGDGAYKVEIQATDTAGKVSTITSAFTIDNTPPLLVLDRPSTAVLTPSASYKDGDTFGDAFWLIGQVYDKSPVAKLEITAAPVGGGTEYTQVINNVPANIRLKVDSFSEDKLKSKFYCALYGTNQSAGKKSFRYSLKVTDNAREYKNPADNAGSGEGNTSNIYYLKDDIDQKVMRNRRLQDIYAVLYGARPESITAEDAATIKAELANPANRIGGKGRTGVFALKPSLNPTFAVIGKTPSREVSGALTPEFSKFYEGASLQVRFSRNLDDVALKPVDPVAPANDPYQFYLVKWETYKGYSSDPSFNINEDASRPGIVRIQRTAVETQDGSYVFTIPVHKTGELEYNKNYVLLVSGKDIDGHELIAVQNEDGANLYGIKLSSTNEPPEVTVTEINGNTNVTERIFVKEGGSVKFKIKLNKQASVTHKLIGAHSSFTPPAALYSAVPNEHEIEIPASEFDQGEDGSYRLTVKAEADGAESFEQTYHIFYDVKEPEVRITEPFGNLYGTQGTGLVIKGTAFDAGSGLADTNPVTVTLTKEDGSNVPVTFATDKKREAWELQSINLPEGAYTLTVTAKDKVGHTKTETLTFTYDKAVPVIKDIKIDDKDNFPVINKTGTFKVKGTVEETYGIKDDKIKIGNEEHTFSSIASSPYFFEKELTRAEGSYDIVITVKDKANNQTSETRTVIVDKTAPVFESIKIATTENVQNGNSITTNSGTVAIKGKIKETGSGVKKLEYQVEGDSDWKELSAANKTDGYYFEGSADIPVNTAKKLFLKVTDNADWITSWECRVTVVPPAVIQWKFGLENNSSPSGTVKYNAGKWYAKGQFKVKIGGVSNPVPSDDAITVKIEKKDTSGTIAPSNFFDNWTGNEPKVSTTDTSKKYTVKAGRADGTYTITIKASNNQEQSLEFTVDGTKPTITPASSGNGVLPANNAWVNSKTLYVSGTATETGSGIEKITATVNGVSTVLGADLLGTNLAWSGYLTLNEGDNTVQFTVTDKAGNSNDPTLAPARTIKVDTGRPTITLTVPADGQALIKDSNYTVKVTTNDVGSSGMEKVEYATTVNFASPQPENTSGGIATINLTGIPAGSTTYYFRAVDKAGNKSDSVQVSIQKDSTGPVINVISPVGEYISTRKPKFEASITDSNGIKANTAKVHYKNLATSAIEDKDLTENSGSYSFTPSSDLDGNKYEFWFSAEDKAGNSTETTHKTITIDTDNPVLADVTVDGKGNSTVYIKQGVSTVAVTGKATDTNGVAKVEILEGGAVKGNTTAISTSDHTWTINLNGASLGSGTHQLAIRATDKAGKIAEVQRTVTVDSENPSVTFDSPRNNQIVNKIITIKGTASDNNGLQSVKIVKVVGSIESDLTGVSASSGQDPSDPETSMDKALFKGTKAYNWQFDLDTNRTEYPNGPLTLKAIATDAAGNTEVKLLTLNVDQNSDRPQIVITNLTSLNAGTYLTASTLNFVIIDDDGEIEDGKFEITSEPANAGTLTKTVGGWQYAFAQDGQKTLKFRVTDKKGGVFETDATDKPRVYAKNTTTTASDASVELKVDTKPPQSETPALQFSNANNYSGLNNLEQNAKFNGGMLYLQIMASDASGIQSVTGKIDNVTSTTEGQNIEHAAAGTAEKWRIKLDLSGVTTEGIKTLTVELTDKAGAKTQFTRTIVLDKTAPTVELTYPAANSAQSGKITVQGNIGDGQDGTGTKAEATKWIVVPSASGEPTAGTTGWKNMKTSTAANWSFDLDFAADFTSIGGHAAYGTPNAVTPAYYDIPVYILTEDNVGNKAVRKITVLYNPDGTKPVVEVLSPTTGSIVGGTIQIFGTGKVAVGTPAHVGEVHIQFSKDEHGTFDSSHCNFNGKDWWNGGNGVLVPNTAGTHSGASWRMDVNSDGNLNNPSPTEERWTLWFRLRAKNKHDNKMGEWTAPIKIIVDKSAPTIGSKIPLKLEHGSQSDDYIPNMWIADNYKLTGSVHDESGIKSIKITGDLKDGTEYDLAKALTDGWIVEDTVNTPTESGKKNYKLQIPLTLNDLKEAAKGKKEFKFTLYVEEDTDKRLSAEKEFTFKFDTEVPTGAYGEHKLIGNGNFETGSITDTVLAAKIKELAPTTDYSKLGILAGGKALTIQSVTGDKVVFTPAISEGRHNYMLYRKGASLIYNASGNWVVKGVAHDEGIGVKEVKVTVTVNSSSETLTIPESSLVSSLSGLWAWEGQIDLSTLSDGKGSLSYEITDKLGNKYTPSSIEVRVKNKPVKISKVILQTEIGGQPVKTDKTDPAETDPKTTVTKTSDAQLDQTVTVESKNFAFKSKTASKIKVEFDGGQGSVRYRLRKGGTVLKEITLPNLPSGIIGDHPLTSGDEIDLKDHLAAIGNSNGTPTTITLELWDEAHGYTQGSTSSSAKVDITTLFDALDQTKPTVVILPFHWNKEDDNSLYKNKRDNGHVEIKETGNSQVSGKVTLRGFAYDNIELKEITATLPNSTSLTVTATRQSDGTWSSDKKMFETDGTTPKDGAELTVTKLGADYLGYYVAWQLDWDTEKATVEAAAKEIRIQAKDGANNTSALPPAPPSPPYSGTDMPTKTTVARSEVKKAESAVFAGTKRGQFVVFKNGETQYLTRITSVDGNEVTLEDAVPKEAADAYMYDYTANKTKTAVNVVPYITGLKRDKKYNTNRSSSGAYNLLRDDKFTVIGFNLAGTLKAVVADGTTNGSEISISSGAFTLPATAKSGKVKITADGVEAINNVTNNSKPYNQKKIANRPETQYWTDDIAIDVWKDDEQFGGSTNPKYPSMAMGSNGDLYAAFSNYSESKVYYSKLGNSTATQVFYAYDPPEEAAISVSGTDTVNILYSANYHGGKIIDWTSNVGKAGGLYCYDAQAQEIIFNGSGTSAKKGNFHRFELFYHNKQLQQFKNFRITRGNNNRIHIAYYDTLSNSIKYATVINNANPHNDNHEYPWINLDGDKDNDDTRSYTGGSSLVLPDGNTNFENGLNRTGGTAEYCAIALDGSNRPVVVYADVDTGTLRLARANTETPMTPPPPPPTTAVANWKVQKVLPSDDGNKGLAEDYFAAQFDSEGYLHIVFRNTRGQICYVKSTNKNTGTTVDAYTFEKSVVIAENGSRVELTMDGTTPYIAYLSKTNAYDGIQIAYYDANLVKTWNADGTENEKGAWNVMTAAMQNRSSAARACVAVAPNNTLGWKAAVGYTPGNVYRVVKYIDK